MNLQHIFIIAKKELRAINSEKTIILAILLQLFIAMFSSFLIVGLAAMYDPDSLSAYSHQKYPVAYTGSPSPLADLLRESKDFVVYDMDLATAVTALEERKLSAVVWVPDTSPDADEPVKITLYTIKNDIQSSVVNSKLRDVFVTYENTLRGIRADRISSDPIVIELPPEVPGTNFYEFVYGLLIPLLIFMPAIISAALIIDMITEEFQHDTIETLISTPVTFTEMIWGKVAACFVIVPVQAFVWIALMIINGIHVAGVVPILLHVSVASLLMILLSTFVALHYRERTSAQFIFSTALVVVLLGVLALPVNPANLIVLLSIGAVGSEHWAALAVMVGVLVFGIAALTRYAQRVEKTALQ
ncbi:ABC transporter permease [Methanogenium organophilum]|uniref:ABC transporter permease n=1 Tax=Methanogenium organophilum TaxID=2199 RepID=A0A9X9S606_METOG|nr:ABC transporter permease [Methanogenium organophilum]WAI02107.1 ABC transporter permease [Methanogenium organophilum]